ncbi:MAG TPA: hypothetical protein VG963_06240, partial [Polyangiaceae bacterium]|nr:hypothetical protein [Polyangiaceae bacterium]
SVVYPTWIRRLAGIFIQDVPAAQLSTESTVNGFSPKQIYLAGSYKSQDLFFAQAIVPGTPTQIYLKPVSLGMTNIGYTGANMTAATLSSVFVAGQAVRIVDTVGRTQYATIDTVTGGANPAIQLAASPALQFRSGSSVGCGINGQGEDSAISVVNIVRYDFRNLNDPANYPGFAPMFRGGPSYESGRRELVREQLDVSGNVVAGSLELIAEYAVDLGFDLLVAPANSTGKLLRVSGGDVSGYAGSPASTPAGQGPQLIRAVHAWLTTRSQEADRTSALSLTPTVAVPGPNKLRMSLDPTDATKGPFARLRTLQSTITLNNQALANWQ